MEFKIKQVNILETPGRKRVQFFCNGIFICETKTGWETYCTVDRSGAPSNIRNKTKRAYYTDWDHAALREMLGTLYSKNDFRDSYPDTTWGSTGGCISLKEVKAKFATICFGPENLHLVAR